MVIGDDQAGHHPRTEGRHRPGGHPVSPLPHRQHSYSAFCFDTFSPHLQAICGFLTGTYG